MAMKNCVARWSIYWGLILLSLPVFAQGSDWIIDPAKSNITFTGTQNNSPVSGNFKSFSGILHGDPDHLDSAKVTITVDMNSVDTPFKDISNTLKTADWFNAKVFPNATFTTDKISKTGENAFQAQGKLTIRDKTVPVTLALKLDEYSASKATVTGTTTLKRTDFGVGTGEWGDLSEVKDDVQVKFTLVAVRK